jgi:hypothetical protein
MEVKQPAIPEFFLFFVRFLFQGGTFIPLYELHDSSPYLEQLNMFQTSTDTVGWVLLPKSTVEVTKVEIIKALKLNKEAVQPISYTVPRKRVRTKFEQAEQASWERKWGRMTEISWL